MNEDITDKRIKAYRAASENIRDLYTNPDVSVIFRSIKEQFVNDEVRYGSLIDLFGDTILGFYSPADFVKNVMAVCGINAETACAIQNELKPYLDQITALYTPPQNPLSPQNLQQSATPNTVSSQGTQRPLTREEVLQALSPKRTMAGDIQSARQPEPPSAT